MWSQTNLQLYSEASQAGWAVRDIDALARAYALALKLFPSRYRGSGRPFTCHLVGTASLALRFCPEDHDLVTAALLHATYAEGILTPAWLPRLQSDTRGCRRQIRRVVGQRCEAMIHSYFCFDWAAFVADWSRFGDCDGQQKGSDPTEVENITLRVANEIDDSLDKVVLGTHGASRSIGPLQVSAKIASSIGAGVLTDLAREQVQHMERCMRGDPLPQTQSKAYTLYSLPRIPTLRDIRRRLHPRGKKTLNANLDINPE